MSDQPGDAASLEDSAPFTFRYQYLDGGVNTGGGWSTWNTNGEFVSTYVAESQAAGVVPVFTYYQLLQSQPGNSQGEPAGDFGNLKNTATMKAYYQDLILFFKRAAGSTPVVLHVEPDLWAYLQQATQNGSPSTIPVQVATTGISNLAGLPNTAAGFAQAFVRLRNAYAPNVMLAYSFSNWASGTNIAAGQSPNAAVTAAGVTTGRFYQALDAHFDIAFTDLSDRDSAYAQWIDGDTTAWFYSSDYAREALFISGFVQEAGIRAVLWQLPLGNTKMRAENDTFDHFQDNKVQWFLGNPNRSNLKSYVNAGVVAMLFGRGTNGSTCACDAAGDGVTNPAPINGNDGVSLNADDDGGFFRQQASRYYKQGAIVLP